MWRVKKNWLCNLENMLIWQTARKSGVISFETHKEKLHNVSKANPVHIRQPTALERAARTKENVIAAEVKS